MHYFFFFNRFPLVGCICHCCSHSHMYETIPDAVAHGTGPTTTMQDLMCKRMLQHRENTFPCFRIHRPVRQQRQVLHALVLYSLSQPTQLKPHSPLAPTNLLLVHPRVHPSRQTLGLRL